VVFSEIYQGEYNNRKSRNNHDYSGL
jgi:hypothetical protein